MKKLLVLVLAVAMLITSLAACKNDPNPNNPADDPKESSSESSPESSESEPEETEEDIGIPEDLDYGGDEVYIMHWKAYNPEFVVDEQAEPEETYMPREERKWSAVSLLIDGRVILSM